MSFASLYVVLTEPTFYIDLRKQFMGCEDTARKADPGMSAMEAAGRCFSGYAISRWQRDDALMERIASSTHKIELEGKLYDPKFVFGQVVAQDSKTAVICKENELLGVKVDGEPLGMGFNVEINSRYATEQSIKSYLNPLMGFIRAYSKAARKHAFEIGSQNRQT